MAAAILDVPEEPCVFLLLSAICPFKVERPFGLEKSIPVNLPPSSLGEKSHEIKQFSYTSTSFGR